MADSLHIKLRPCQEQTKTQKKSVHRVKDREVSEKETEAEKFLYEYCISIVPTLSCYKKLNLLPITVLWQEKKKAPKCHLFQHICNLKVYTHTVYCTSKIQQMHVNHKC